MQIGRARGVQDLLGLPSGLDPAEVAAESRSQAEGRRSSCGDALLVNAAMRSHEARAVADTCREETRATATGWFQTSSQS